MLLKIVGLVFLFIVRLRFPLDKPISVIIRLRYGDSVLKSIRKFEKLDFKIRKLLLDLNFLDSCVVNNVIPRFLHFRTTNAQLQNSASYEECQKLLLQEEMANKRAQLEVTKLDFKKLKKELFGIMSVFDYLYITSLFLDGNVKSSEKIESKQYLKLTISLLKAT